jgi:hypothetical protein
MIMNGSNGKFLSWFFCFTNKSSGSTPITDSSIFLNLPCRISFLARSTPVRMSMFGSSSPPSALVPVRTNNNALSWQSKTALWRLSPSPKLSQPQCRARDWLMSICLCDRSVWMSNYLHNWLMQLVFKFTNIKIFSFHTKRYLSNGTGMAVALG